MVRLSFKIFIFIYNQKKKILKKWPGYIEKVIKSDQKEKEKNCNDLEKNSNAKFIKQLNKNINHIKNMKKEFRKKAKYSLIHLIFYFLI